MLLHVELLLGEDADVDEFLELLQRFHLFCDAHGGGVRGRCRAGSGGCRIGTARAFGCKCGLRLRLLRLRLRGHRHRRCRRRGHRIDGLSHVHAEEHAAAITETVVLDALGDLLLRGHVAGRLRDALVRRDIHLVRSELAHELARLLIELDALDADAGHLESEAIPPRPRIRLIVAHACGDIVRMGRQLRNSILIGQRVDGDDERLDEFGKNLFPSLGIVERVRR